MNILLQSIFGPSAAFLLKWLKEKLCLLVIQKSIKYSKFSKFKELQMRIIGQRHLNTTILKQISLGGKE